jgi:hypothetical protein
MTLVIATMRLPLQASISSADSQLWLLSIRGGVLLGAPYEDNDSGSSISSLMVVERDLSSRGDEFAAYVVPDGATTDDAFWTDFEALDLAACPMFWGWSLDSA